MAKTGVELIAEERQRQIKKEGWSAEHDDEHINGEMAMAAACYAAPQYLNRINDDGEIRDPWPWTELWDKRRCKDASVEIPNPETYSPEVRLDLLVKAGALIAAEIDRLNRLKEKQKP